jgi:hypothetical protein
MEKLKKINQILFFVMASLAIIMLIIGLFTIIREHFFDRYRDYDDSVVSNLKAEKLIEENKRSQLIEFDSVDLVDSLNQIYIIPVRQKNLRKLQDIEDPPTLNIEVEDMPITAQESYKPSSSSYLYYYGYNTFNNILIYNGKTKISHPIFSNRIAIIDYIVYSIKNEKHIFIVACDEDDNSDGKFDKNDKLKIFTYNISKKELNQITKKGDFILASWRLHYSDNIVLKIGIDIDNDNKFSSEYEPEIFKTFDVKNETYNDLIDLEIRSKLQDILDGKFIKNKP